MAAKWVISSKRFFDLSAAEPQYRPVKKDVLTPREIGIEPGAQLKQRSNTAVAHHGSGGRAERPADQLQQGGFTAAIAANDADRLPLEDGQVDVFDSP